MTFLWRMAGRPQPVSNTPLFTDVATSSFSAKPVAWAAEVGIVVHGTATEDELPSFGTTTTATRDLTAAFIHRFALLNR